MYNNSRHEYSADPNAKYGYNAEYLQAVDKKFKITYLGHSTLDPVVIKLPNGHENMTSHTQLSRKSISPNNLVLDMPNERNSPTSGSKTPMDLADVSSDEEDSDLEESQNDETNTEYFRHQNVYSYEKRLKSISRAKAALPSDFQNRIASGNNMDGRILKSRENVQISDEDRSDATDNSESELSAQNNIEDSDGPQESSSEEEGIGSYRPQKSSGIIWKETSYTLIEMIKDFKARRIHGSHLIKSICQKPNCRCAFRGHEILLMFTLLDSYLAYATWEKTPAPKSSTRQLVANLNSNNSIKDVKSSEIEANLMVFRQCRGWYEVLNEDGVAIPYWSTLEQLNRNNQMTFLARKDIRVLLAPSDLTFNPIEMNSIPISFIDLAQSQDTIAASTPFVMKSGTLFRFISYLPNRVLKRGRRVKTLNLVLAIEHHTPANSDDSKNPERTMHSKNPNIKKLFYIGLEESSRDSYFPSSLHVSSVAGPDNISGVHSMAGILRKFRLPISIRPVGVYDSPQKTSDTYNSYKSVEFPLMRGLTYTERHIMRLRSIYRGDLLIIAPADNPERFYIITPSMLKDHKFYHGHSEDKCYSDLLKNHCSKIGGFLATAHSKDSLEYLLKYMTDTTHLPRVSIKQNVNEYINPQDGYTHEEAVGIAARTGKDPRVGTACNLGPDDVTQIFEEIDDIYFYIRNGYYPKKNRIKSKSRMGEYNVSNSNSNYAYSRKISTNNRSSPVNSSSVPVQKYLPNAEQLLAASLKIDKDIPFSGGINNKI